MTITSKDDGVVVETNDKETRVVIEDATQKVTVYQRGVDRFGNIFYSEVMSRDSCESLTKRAFVEVIRHMGY